MGRCQTSDMTNTTTAHNAITVEITTPGYTSTETAILALSLAGDPGLERWRAAAREAEDRLGVDITDCQSTLASVYRDMPSDLYSIARIITGTARQDPGIIDSADIATFAVKSTVNQVIGETRDVLTSTGISIPGTHALLKDLCGEQLAECWGSARAGMATSDNRSVSRRRDALLMVASPHQMQLARSRATKNGVCRGAEDINYVLTGYRQHASSDVVLGAYYPNMPQFINDRIWALHEFTNPGGDQVLVNMLRLALGAICPHVTESALWQALESWG